MKRIMTIALIVLCSCATAMAANDQQGDDVFITITDHDLYSRCFITCDADGDGKVTYAEAKEATTLILDLGGRSNIIENYDFLKYFPNLTTLSVGNTTVEAIDLSKNTKLEHLGLVNALWINEITLAVGCHPEIVYPFSEGTLTVKRVKTE